MPSPTESTPAVNTNLSELQTIDSLIYSHKWFIDDLQHTYDLSYSFVNKNSVFDDFNYDGRVNKKENFELTYQAIFADYPHLKIKAM